jgi:hypothetical protein
VWTFENQKNPIVIINTTLTSVSTCRVPDPESAETPHERNTHTLKLGGVSACFFLPAPDTKTDTQPDTKPWEFDHRNARIP